MKNELLNKKYVLNPIYKIILDESVKEKLLHLRWYYNFINFNTIIATEK